MFSIRFSLLICCNFSGFNAVCVFAREVQLWIMMCNAQHIFFVIFEHFFCRVFAGVLLLQEVQLWMMMCNVQHICFSPLLICCHFSALCHLCLQVFSSYEKWEFFDALYYCFATLTTIGISYLYIFHSHQIILSPKYIFPKNIYPQKIYFPQKYTFH